MIKIAIVILNWNGKKFLEKFLPSVVEYSPAYAEIIVADNDSSDDSIDFLKNKYPQIRLIRNNENGGFAKGYNDALSQVEAKYYVLLNSDIEVTPNWVDPIVDFMDQNDHIAACQPKILSYHQKTHFEYAGAGGGYIDKYGYPFCRGRIFQEIEEDQQQYDDIKEVFWASGACMFLRADVFHQLGGLDNDFFAHMEEIDFCWRAKNTGYKIYYHPESAVYHVGGGTLPKNNPHKTYLNFRNNFFLLYKNLPSNRIFPVFFWRLVLDGVAGFKFLIDGNYKDTFAVLRAHIHFYLSIGSLSKKRKKLHHIPATKVYQRNIVFEHFVRKINSYQRLNLNRFS